MAKVGLEALAARFLRFADWADFVIDDPQLDPIRRFARYGDVPPSWPFLQRRLYDEDALHGGQWQVLHEFDFLFTSEREIFAVICIFGTEFAINMGGPAIDGYERWLSENNNRSPLYLKEELSVA